MDINNVVSACILHTK